jgi:hypothetical protein
LLDVVTETCLPSSCIAMDVYSGSAIPAFSGNITIFISFILLSVISLELLAVSFSFLSFYVFLIYSFFGPHSYEQLGWGSVLCVKFLGRKASINPEY